MEESLVFVLLVIIILTLMLIIVGLARMDETINAIRQTAYRAELRASTACQLIKELEQRIVSMTGDTHESRQQHSRRRDEDPACQVRSDLS